MNEPGQFSLSYFLDELNRRDNPSGPSEPVQTKSGMPTTASISVLKTLMGCQNHTLSLMALAKKANLKIGESQMVAEHLQEEGLVDIEPDMETGNDTVRSV